MAQVTMDSKEYLELVDKSRQLDNLKAQMVDTVEVEINPDATYNPCRVTFRPVMPLDTQFQIVELVVDQILAADPELLKHLVSENEHFLHLHSGYINNHWNNEPEQDEVDLLKNKKFRVAWDNMQKQLDEEE
jgi:hypothetical protein